MPRTYVRKSNVPPRGVWTEENLQKALKAIEDKQSGKEKLGLNEIARRYGIPPRTLRRRYKNKNTKKLTLGRHPALDFENEDLLVEIIQDLEKEGVLLTRVLVRKIAYEFAEQLNLNVPFKKETRMAGHGWLLSFYERHPQLNSIQKECQIPGKTQDPESELDDTIKEKIKNSIEERNQLQKLNSKSDDSDSNECNDPLLIKIERSDVYTDDITIEEHFENMEGIEENSASSRLSLADAAEECSSTDIVVNCKNKIDVCVKRPRKESNDETSHINEEDLVPVKCDRIDLLFLGYAAALKKMSRRKQITVKHEIAKIFMEAELSELD